MTTCGREKARSTHAAGTAASAVGRRRTHAVVVAIACAVALAGVATRDARASGSPAPQKLWRSFPLDARQHSFGARASSQPQTATARSRTAPRRSRNPMSASVWAATAGALIVALLAVAVVAGRVHVPVPARNRRRLLRRQRLRNVVAEVIEAKPNSTATAVAQDVEEQSNGAGGGETRVKADRNNEDVRAPSPPERRPEHERELEVLKRKGATPSADADELLRAKARLRGSRENTKERQVSLLKAKLAGAAQQPARAIRGSGKRRRSAASRAAAPPAKTGSAARTQTVRVSASVESARCRIVCRRGGDGKAKFEAWLRTPEGRESLLTSSQVFRWNEVTPPPEEVPDVARAHAALVARLAADGWVPAGPGDDWYAIELHRPAAERPRPRPAQERKR